MQYTIAGDSEGFSVFIDKKFINEQKNDWKMVPLNGSWVLGQQQEVFEGGFENKDRVKGHLCDFQMWDFKMSKEQLELLFSKEVSLKGNFFDSPPTYDYQLRNQAKVGMPGHP